MASHRHDHEEILEIQLDETCTAPLGARDDAEGSSGLPELLLEPLDELSLGSPDRRRGSSFHLLVAMISITLAMLFFAGRGMLRVADVYAAPSSRPAERKEPGSLPASEAAPEESEDSEPDAGGDRLRAVRLENELSRWAAFGAEALCLRGNASVETAGAPRCAVGSNGPILLLAEASVEGDVAPGPGAALERRGDARHSGVSVPLSLPVELFPIEPPATQPGGPIELAAAERLELGPGDRAHDALEVGEGAVLRVRGPACLVVPSLHLGRGARVEVDAQDGPVEIYVAGDFLLESGAELGSTRDEARDLTLLLAADNVHDAGAKLDFSAGFDARGARLCARVYAPRARIVLDAHTELHGSLVARIVELDGSARIVY